MRWPVLPAGIQMFSISRTRRGSVSTIRMAGIVSRPARACDAGRASTTTFMAMMCSGPVAQQPPTIWAPIAIHSWASSASREGLWAWAEMMSGPRCTRPPTGAIGL